MIPFRADHAERLPRTGRDRRGFTLIEATVSVALLMVSMTTALQAVSWLVREGRAIDRRAFAIREAEHLLDAIVEGTSDPDLPPEIGPEGEQRLPGLSIAVDRETETLEGMSMQQFTVTLRYEDRPGVAARPVRLSCWAAREPGEPPGGGTDGEIDP